MTKGRRLRLEQLEDRRMLVVLMVNSFEDNSDIDTQTTLREAVNAATLFTGHDTIEFDPSLDGASIVLSLGELNIIDSLTIDASALPNGITINGNQGVRIFNVDDGNSATTIFFDINNLHLTNAFPTGNGGAIYSSENLTVRNSTIVGTGADFGGGIYSSGSLLIERTEISQAGAVFDGGGIYVTGDTIIRDSTIANNSANGQGGGIYVLSSAANSVLLDTVTVSGNAAKTGGGIYVAPNDLSGVVTIHSSTITNNTASGQNVELAGGGIVTFSAVNLNNSIITANRGVNDVADDLLDLDGKVSTSYSLVGSDSGNTLIETAPGSPDAAGNLVGGTVNGILDPLLGDLSNNGGPTRTHALLNDSPAIDMGDPSFTTPPDFDQRGAPFVRVSGGRVDMGAYEQQTLDPLFFVVTTVTDELDYSNADVSLRETIYSAKGSIGAETITFAAGLSGGTINLDQALGELEITNAVTIDATSLPQNVIIDANQQSRIFNFTADSGDLTLAGLTIIGGRTTGNNQGSFDNTNSGGGIRSLSLGSLIVKNSSILNNSTLGSGAKGGGIYSIGDIKLIESIVSGNSTAGENAGGGGVFTLGPVSATGDLNTGSVMLTKSVVSNNAANGQFSSGGGIMVYGSAVLEQSSVSGNIAAGSGGGIYGTVSIDLDESTVDGNIAENAGGGIDSHGYPFSLGGRLGGHVSLVNSTVSGNRTNGDSANGGGIQAYGIATLNQSTVSGNSTLGNSADGGGIWSENDPVEINNSILANNSAGGANPDLRAGVGEITVNFSLIDDNSGTDLAEAQSADADGNLIGSAVGAGVIDPLLGPLANNGGPTETHALLIGSPAIDAADPALTGVGLFDQRGAPFVRVFGGRVDMGAYELQPDGPALPGDYNHNKVVDAADYTVWLGALGQSVTPFESADGNGDGTVDQGDYDVWRANFGAVLNIPPGSVTTDFEVLYVPFMDPSGNIIDEWELTVFLTAASHADSYEVVLSFNEDLSNPFYSEVLGDFGTDAIVSFGSLGDGTHYLGVTAHNQCGSTTTTTEVVIEGFSANSQTMFSPVTARGGPNNVSLNFPSLSDGLNSRSSIHPAIAPVYLREPTIAFEVALQDFVATSLRTGHNHSGQAGTPTREVDLLDGDSTEKSGLDQELANTVRESAFDEFVFERMASEKK